MKYFKLVLGVIIGLLAVTLVAEIVEFIIVKSISDKSFGYLQENQSEYFNIRNRNSILIAKIGYSLFAGIIGGYLATWISKTMSNITIWILIVIQIISLIWGGFFSDLSSTGPIWMWIYLLIVVPSGIWIGYKWRTNNALQNSVKIIEK